MKNLILVVFLFVTTLLFSDYSQGTCLEFDGVDDYVQVNQSVIPASGDFSVSVWAKTNSSTAGTFEILSQDGGAGTNFYLGCHMGYIRCGDSWMNTGIAYPTDGAWHYFTVAKNASDTYLYIDGIYQVGLGSPIENPTGSEFRIGRQFGPYGEYFSGQIDEARIWNSCRWLEWDYADTYRYSLGIEEGLSTYWQFNEASGTSTTDFSGTTTGNMYNMNAGSWATSSVPIQSAFVNESGNCFDFDGVDDYMQCNSPVIPTSGDFTLSIWAKTLIVNNVFEIISQNAGGVANFYLGYINGYIRAGDSWGDTGVLYPTDEEWHNFTVAKNSSNTYLYIDGVQVAERGYAILNPAGSEFRLGRQYDSYGGYFKGQLDELRVWNTCLTQEQVQNKMNRCFDDTEDDLSAYWQFNEYRGILARDYVGINLGTFHNTGFNDWPASSVEIHPYEGVGTDIDPYRIANITDLWFLSAHSYLWDRSFIQTADIDASDTMSWNSGAGFSPIGDYYNEFSGKYNGNGYIIDGLFINRPFDNLIGLFGKCSSSNIINVGLNNINVTGGYYVGGLAGEIHNSSINNCYSTCTINGDGYVGGLIGNILSASTVENSYSSGNIVSNSYSCGGFMGNNNGVINNCYSTCNVVGYDMTGGFGGYNNGTINNCYSKGNAEGYVNAGGFSGYNDGIINNSYSKGNAAGDENIGGFSGSNYGTITNCYSTGFVTGNIDFGGFVGWGGGTASTCFWDTQTSGQSTSIGGTGKTSAEMKMQYTYTGWDFVNIWDISYYELDYPFFGDEYDTPADAIPSTPQNIQITLQHPHAILTWDEVTHSTEGDPIYIDGYIILFSEDQDHYFFLTVTRDIPFSHRFVMENSSSMYYNVIAASHFNSRQMLYLEDLSRRLIKQEWEDVKVELERIKKTPQQIHNNTNKKEKDHLHPKSSHRRVK